MLKNTLLISSLVVTSIAFPQVGGPGGAKSQEKGTLGAAVKQGAKDPEQIVPLELNEDDYHMSKMAPKAGFSFAPIVFFASYGDNNQQFDNSAGSIDKRTSYSWPPKPPFPAHPHPLGVDMDQITHDHVYPYAISGYPRFNPKRVVEAKLRFDVYIQPNVSLWDNDSIGGWNDATNTSFALTKPGTATQAGDFAKFLVPFLKARKALYPHWVSIVFDLTPNPMGGGVYVYDINAFGNPIQGRYWGMFQTITLAQQMKALEAASDGDFQGWLQDDTPLSYAELMIKAY